MSWFDWGGGIDWGQMGDVGVAMPEWAPQQAPGSEWSGMDWSGMNIQMPEWSGYVPAQTPQSYMWDTTTGQLVPPGGAPGDGQGQYVTQQPQGEDYTRYTPPGTGEGRYVTQSGEPGQGPGVWDKLSGGVDSLNKVLQTPLGRTAGSLGIGALGLGAQRLITGNQPPYQASPITQAGNQAWLNAMGGGGSDSLQRAIQSGVAGQAGIGQQVAGRVAREAAAEETGAPAEAAIRAAAYPQVAGLMQPGQEQALPDPIQAAMRDELMAVLSGGATGVNPLTQKRQQQEEAQTRARLFQQEGRDYELTTAGIQTLNELKQRHNSEQYNERLQTINQLATPEQNRAQWAETAPVNLLGQRENIRRGNLQDAAGMTQFGIRGVNQNLPALSAVAPINRLMGESSPDQANQVNYGAKTAGNAALAQGIGSVAGTVAGQIGQRPSALDTYFDRLYGNSSGFTSAA